MTPIKTRHCLYHAYAPAGDAQWMHNIDVLGLWQAEAFNGSKIAAIATGPESEPFEIVAARLEPMGFHCHEFGNDPQIREVASFVPLLDMIQTTADDVAVFYAHTKGNTTKDGKRGARIWRNVMYRELVREWKRCVKHLEDYAAVGTHRIAWGKHKPPYPTQLRHGKWMFAGTYFWFRADRVFTRPDWSILPRDRYAAEAWLSGMFSIEETKSVYQLWPEKQYPTPSPYWPMTYPEQDQSWEPLSSQDARA